LPGFPIRRSTDRSLIGSSPWLFAAVHVLHRHLAPRHPPLALCSLGVLLLFTYLYRCSCSLCSSQGPHGTDGPGSARGHRRRTSDEVAGDKFERTSLRESLPQNGTVTSGNPGSGGAPTPASRAEGRKVSGRQLTSDRRGSSPSLETNPKLEQCAP
jgi:hypothetical protein